MEIPRVSGANLTGHWNARILEISREWVFRKQSKDTSVQVEDTHD
jgi:hypothetical protein